MKINEDTLNRFWKRTNVGKPDECWSFNNTNPNTRPNFSGMYASRAIFILTRKYIPMGLSVCHSCHNDMCVNPSHLYAGTKYDNGQDLSESKGYDVRLLQLLHSSGMSAPDIARMLHLSIPPVYRAFKMVKSKHDGRYRLSDKPIVKKKVTQEAIAEKKKITREAITGNQSEKKLYELGYTVSEIAQARNVSTRTIYRRLNLKPLTNSEIWIRELKAKGGNDNYVANLEQ